MTPSQTPTHGSTAPKSVAKAMIFNGFITGPPAANQLRLI